MPADLRPIETTQLSETALEWYDLLDVGLEGRAFGADQCEHPYDRLPASARGVVSGRVWELGREATGLRARFVTDACDIHARWWLRGPQDILAHIPHSGQVGLDLYAQDGERWRFAGAASCNSIGAGEMQGALATGMTAQPRQFMLYLPYRKAVGRVLVGLSAGSTIRPAQPSPHTPLCFYGTSIVHGASANRAGMTWPAQVSRRLDRPFYNFGFGGNGPMHLEMARILADLDASVFLVAGCENMSPQLVAERAEPFAGILREKHPHTPIVFVGNLRYANGWLSNDRRDAQEAKNRNLAAAVQNLRDAGDAHVHLIDGPLVGQDDEATGDGVHPTDLGFFRMADRITPVLARLLPS